MITHSILKRIFDKTKSSEENFIRGDSRFLCAYCCCMFGDDEETMASKEDCDAMKAKGVQTWTGAGIHDAETVDIAIERVAYLITCNNQNVIRECLRARGVHK